jgi:hypothetical protein
MSRAWFALFVLLLSSAAQAHDWYPIECCHMMDCAPVDSVDTSNNQLVVKSKLGSVSVPATFPRRESKDHRMHVCMRPDPAGGMHLICIFLPPAT